MSNEEQNPLSRPRTTLPLNTTWAIISLAFETIISITHRDVGLLHKHANTPVHLVFAEGRTTEEGFVADILDLGKNNLIQSDVNISDATTVEEYAYFIASVWVNNTNSVPHLFSLEDIANGALANLTEVYALRDAETKRIVKNREAHEESVSIPETIARPLTEEELAESPDSLLAAKFFISYGTAFSLLEGVKTMRGARISASRVGNSVMDKTRVSIGQLILKGPDAGKVKEICIREAGADKWKDSTETELFSI